MATNLQLMLSLVREAHAAAQSETGTMGERSIYAWGRLLGSLMRHGMSAKELPGLMFERTGKRQGAMTLDAIMRGIGQSINEVLLTTPTTMLDTEPEEALEDMACRFVLETVKRGLVILDRVSYDRLVRENADLKRAVLTTPSADC